MAQTRKGAALIAAKKGGISLKKYNSLIEKGFKKCSLCKKWINKELFNKDITRVDHLSTICRSCEKIRHKNKYVSKPRPAKGRRFILPRANDKKQARGRINYLIEAGLLDNPNNVKCVDCGHLSKIDNRRHEYDHHLGYGENNHEIVEVVCSKCHHRREKEKNESYEY